MRTRPMPMRLLHAVAAVGVSGLLVACATSGAEEIVAPRPTTSTTAATTTTTMEPAPEPAPAAAVPAPSPVKHKVLPANDAPAPRRAPAAAPVRRGPQPLGRIQIGRIGLDHAIYEGETLDVLKYGPGHWRGTAMPGQVGNTVFPGHRTTHSRPFWDIDRIQKGDAVVFITDAGRFTYQVTDTFIVDDSETWVANSTKDPTFTIFACHPKGSAKQRYVVKGNLVGQTKPSGSPPPPQSPPPQQQPPPQQPPPQSPTTTTPCILCL